MSKVDQYFKCYTQKFINFLILTIEYFYKKKNKSLDFEGLLDLIMLHRYLFFLFFFQQSFKIQSFIFLFETNPMIKIKTSIAYVNHLHCRSTLYIQGKKLTKKTDITSRSKVKVLKPKKIELSNQIETTKSDKSSNQ